jgi:hypothetical protein
VSILSPLYPRSDQELTFRIGQLQSRLLNASSLAQSPLRSSVQSLRKQHAEHRSVMSVGYVN